MTQPSRLLICSEAEADLHAYRLSREPGIAIRFIRGRRCAVLDRCMGEFAAAFQLPYCFEGTWPSLALSLKDTTWPAGTRLLLLITCVNRVLPRAAADFTSLMQTLLDFASTSTNLSGMEILLHVEPRYQQQTLSRFAAAGIPLRAVEE